MSAIRSTPSFLFGLFGAWLLGILLGGSAVWLGSDDGRASSTDPSGIEARFAALHERMDVQQRVLLQALARIEATAEASRRVAASDASVPIEPPAAATQATDPALRGELAALREEIARMNRERTMGEIGELVREFRLPRIERRAVSLEDLRGMSPEDRANTLRWRSFEDVQKEFGTPARFSVTGTAMVWEYDPPGGGLLGLRFVNGRVVDAWN